MKFSSLRSTIFFVSAIPRAVHGCGGFFCTPRQPVVQSAETIAFGVQQKANGMVDVTMSVQIEYEGPTERFSWILPMPAVPNVTVGTDALFARLMAATNPTFELDIKTDPVQGLTVNPNDACSGTLCFASPARISAPESVADGGGAVVVDTGSVGPFDYVIIESPEGDTDAAYRWLNENGFDQPEMAGPLLNYYAVMGMKFLALKLSKNNDAGDIQPIVLQYELQGDVLNDALACVPIQLTAVATAAALPVQVFLLGPYRAVPVNYLEAEMDLELVDWLGCDGNENCFLNDHRARANAMFSQLQGKAFTTEYSGDTSNFEGIVALDIDLDEYNMLETPEKYLETLQRDSVPYTNQVHGIVSEYIENVSRLQSGRSACRGQTFIFISPFVTQVCLGNDIAIPPVPTIDVSVANETTMTEAEPVFDAVGLTEELNAKVYALLEQDEAWLLSHGKLTRMYGNFAGPDDMTKDPFFAFRAELPDVSNVHRASAIPVCETTRASLNFTIGDDLSFQTEVRNVCGRWVRENANVPLFNATVLTARNLVAQGFGPTSESSRFVQMRGGVLDLNDLGEIEAMLDGRVPNQTLPEWPRATPVVPFVPPLTVPPSMTPPADNVTDDMSASGVASTLTSAVWAISVAVAYFLL